MARITRNSRRALRPAYYVSLFTSGSGSRRLASPVRGVFQIAASFVFRILRIRTHWTSQSLCSISHHLIGSDPLFDPFLERADRIERVDSGTAAAVAHAGRHEKTHPVTLIPAHLVKDGFVVPDRGFRRDSRVRPAVSQKQFAVALFEFAEIRIDGVHVSDGIVD